MKSPVVSILINNYNYGRFLRQAIDSALSQTYPHCEVVVVDDGSTDDSRDIIRSYEAKVCPVFKENGGQGSAYNAGFARATGDIIMLLDSDDYFAPIAAERIVSAWQSDTQILHHRVQIIDSNGKNVGHWPSKPQPLDSGDILPILLKTGLYWAPPSSGLVYSRGLLQKLLPLPEADFRICADAWLFFQAPFFAPIAVLDEELAFYRLHGSNNWGPSWPTRLTSRSRLETFMMIRGRGLALIEKQATAKGLAYDPLDWENPITLRWKLILLRLGSSPSTGQARATMVRTILQKIRSAPYSPLRKIKEGLLTILIWLAPRIVLRGIFPNMF